MRYFLAVVFTTLVSTAFTRAYYFSSTMGDDSRMNSQAQKAASPWKSLSKLNSIFTLLAPGDSILLKRGDTFYGSIIVTKSGSESLPIVISAYGSGKLPIITGFVTISKWNEKGKGIFTSSQQLADSALNMVVINDVLYARGRYPNRNAQGGGWLPVQSHEGNDALTSSAPLSVDWTNAELVVRKKRYVIDRNEIISQAGSSLRYKSGTQYEPTNGLGFFVQNHIQTLDQFGEWYYDPVLKTLNLYFDKKSMANFIIRASNVNTLISVRKQDNISFQNIELEGSNLKAFDLYYSKNISIKNCVINFSGVDAIDGFNTQNLVVENCTITNSNNNGFDLTGLCNGSQLRNNIIRNTGLQPGMAGNSAHSFSGININGDNNLVEYNEVDSSGYIGIRFAGNSTTIKNNFINYFCFLKDDGGGIYTFNGDVNNAKRDQVIQDNIVLNGIGAQEGTSEKSLQAVGIYLDDNSANIKVSGNSMAYSNKAGLYLHNGHDLDISNNTFYSNGTQLIVQKDAASKGFVRNNSIKNNIFFSKESSQFVASFLTNEDDINLFGKIDDNYYSRPIDDNVVISTSFVDKTGGKINKYFDLDGWKSRYKKDASSRKSSFRLSSYKINNLVSSNKILNGNFNTDIAGVHGVKCKVNWQNSTLSGGSLQVTSLSNTLSSYITIPVGAINTGKNYVLKFSMKGSGDSDESIGILLRQNGSPYRNLAVTTYKTIAGKAQDYEVSFSATQDEENALLVFTLSDATTYSLDNMQLYEANATITNPEDHFLFEYNAGRAAKTILLNGSYIDTQNKVYTKSIILQPYTSAILTKQN
ncbi:MAG: right-handed parallel beta-helix repeat-containing protein [Ginsengibacter sp.]